MHNYMLKSNISLIFSAKKYEFLICTKIIQVHYAVSLLSKQTAVFAVCTDYCRLSKINVFYQKTISIN